METEWAEQKERLEQELQKASETNALLQDQLDGLIPGHEAEAPQHLPGTATPVLSEPAGREALPQPIEIDWKARLDAKFAQKLGDFYPSRATATAPLPAALEPAQGKDEQFVDARETADERMSHVGDGGVDGKVPASSGDATALMSFVWRGEYLVTKLEAIDYHLEHGSVVIQRTKRLELPSETHVFPLKAKADSLEPPPEPIADRVIPPVPDPIIPQQSDLEYTPSIAPDPVVESAQEKEPPVDVEMKKSSAEPREPGETMPDGSIVPDGYHYDGVRLVKTYKGYRDVGSSGEAPDAAARLAAMPKQEGIFTIIDPEIDAMRNGNVDSGLKAGSPWTNVDKDLPNGSERIAEQQQLFGKLFKSFKRCIADASPHKPSVTFELSKNCKYWSWPSVQKFISDYKLRQHVRLKTSGPGPAKRVTFSGAAARAFHRSPLERMGLLDWSCPTHGVLRSTSEEVLQLGDLVKHLEKVGSRMVQMRDGLGSIWVEDVD
ncbi:unnamed protein product [Durusdinium trenchii]|uniref:Uncharacterized protein n=1 Tax=Durusdinium trenchii TaxID=1381693 RepID=A0ABP0NHI8_9DINO